MNGDIRAEGTDRHRQPPILKGNPAPGRERYHRESWSGQSVRRARQVGPLRLVSVKRTRVPCGQHSAERLRHLRRIWPDLVIAHHTSARCCVKARDSATPALDPRDATTRGVLSSCGQLRRKRWRGKSPLHR